MTTGRCSWPLSPATLGLARWAQAWSSHGSRDGPPLARMTYHLPRLNLRPVSSRDQHWPYPTGCCSFRRQRSAWPQGGHIQPLPSWKARGSSSKAQRPSPGMALPVLPTEPWLVPPPEGSQARTPTTASNTGTASKQGVWGWDPCIPPSRSSWPPGEQG